PSNWLAETPETFTSRRLGRQSAERERISGIDSTGTFLKEKISGKLTLLISLSEKVFCDEGLFLLEM
ncbi:hypothetical protein CMV16_19880, partial [Peribacillus simplex]